MRIHFDLLNVGVERCASSLSAFLGKQVYFHKLNSASYDYKLSQLCWKYQSSKPIVALALLRLPPRLGVLYTSMVREINSLILRG